MRELTDREIALFDSRGQIPNLQSKGRNSAQVTMAKPARQSQHANVRAELKPARASRWSRGSRASGALPA